MDVVAIDQLGEQRLVGEGVDGVLEARIRLQMPDVADRAGREIVDDVDVVSGVQQRLRRWEPMKPAPPVINALKMLPFARRRRLVDRFWREAGISGSDSTSFAARSASGQSARPMREGRLL
jgi:hypothetical protein